MLCDQTLILKKPQPSLQGFVYAIEKKKIPVLFMVILWVWLIRCNQIPGDQRYLEVSVCSNNTFCMWIPWGCLYFHVSFYCAKKTFI